MRRVAATRKAGRFSTKVCETLGSGKVVGRLSAFFHSLIVCGIGLAAAVWFVFSATASAQWDLESLAARANTCYDRVPRKVLAFYYPWYGNAEVSGGSGRWSHWSGVEQDAKRIASSTHYPLLGAYDSHEPALIAAHCRWAKAAGIDGWIVSWWGHGSFEDRAMPRILDACRTAGLDVTVYYETVPQPRTPQSAADDIVRVLERHGDHPAWFRLNGKPVVFVYGRAVAEIGVAGWLEAADRIHRRYTKGAVLIGDQFSPAAARVFDGVHTYNTAGRLRGLERDDVKAWAAETYPQWVAMADAVGRISTLTVIPGYDDTKIRKPGLAVDRMDGDSYRAQWEAVLAADPAWVLITSWNEWHEGSEIEPSAEYGEQYLKLTSEYTRRFHARAEHRPRAAFSGEALSEAAKGAALAKLGQVQIGLLPDPNLEIVWALLKLPTQPKLLGWEDVAALQADDAARMPLLIYSGGEHYRSSMHESGDVDEGLFRYLKAGGTLVVIPSGPMPFHYDERGRGVGNSRKFGLPLSVAGADGGWETPPEGVDLHFVQVGRPFPDVPQQFPFDPPDPRWRPLVGSRLPKDDLLVPLVELRDAAGKRYGIAVGYVEHKASEPLGGKLLYAWFGLLEGSRREAILYDILGWIGERAGRH